MSAPACLLVAVASLAPAMARPALAAQTSSAAPTASHMSLPDFSWTGFYSGQASGYRWAIGATKSAAPYGFLSTAADAAGGAFSTANGTSSAPQHSLLGGGELGFNYQVKNFVFGVEGDLTYAGAGDTADLAAPSGVAGSLAFTSNIDSHWLSTLRGRFGTAFNRVLVYATGGLAVAGRNFDNGYAIVSPDGQDYWLGSSSTVATGFAIGGGLEYALSKNWTLNGEYLYANLGPGHSLAPDGSSGPDNAGYRQGELSEKVLRATINYKFDWPSLLGSGSGN